MGEEQTVSYPLTVVLDRIEGKVDRLIDHLDAKAERSEVAALDKRIAALELAEATRRTGSEVAREHQQARTEWKRWIWPTLLTAAFAVISLIQLFVH